MCSHGREGVLLGIDKLSDRSQCELFFHSITIRVFYKAIAASSISSLLTVCYSQQLRFKVPPSELVCPAFRFLILLS